MRWFEDVLSYCRLLICLICDGIWVFKELFFSMMLSKLVFNVGKFGFMLLLFRFIFWRFFKLFKLGIVLLIKLLVKIRYFKFFKEEIFCGILLNMKFELILSSLRDCKWLIFGGKWFYKFNEIKESFFKFGSLVRLVNKEFMENFWDKVCLDIINFFEVEGFGDWEGEVLFLVIVNLVICLFE